MFTSIEPTSVIQYGRWATDITRLKTGYPGDMLREDLRLWPAAIDNGWAIDNPDDFGADTPIRFWRTVTDMSGTRALEAFGHVDMRKGWTGTPIQQVLEFTDRGLPSGAGPKWQLTHLIQNESGLWVRTSEPVMVADDTHSDPLALLLVSAFNGNNPERRFEPPRRAFDDDVGISMHIWNGRRDVEDDRRTFIFRYPGSWPPAA